LIAGRTAQEFNQRKGRKGAYWEDRYHATAVASDDHLVRCICSGSGLYAPGQACKLAS
jgi:putative transposase